MRAQNTLTLVLTSCCQALHLSFLLTKVFISHVSTSFPLLSRNQRRIGLTSTAPPGRTRLVRSVHQNLLLLFLQHFLLHFASVPRRCSAPRPTERSQARIARKRRLDFGRWSACHPPFFPHTTCMFQADSSKIPSKTLCTEENLKKEKSRPTTPARLSDVFGISAPRGWPIE